MSNLPELSLDQRNALEERLLNRRRSAATLKAAGAIPLSPAQESIWIAEQLAPGRPLYNIPLAFRLEGSLQPDLFRQAWSAVARRHQALRTRISLAEQRPQQQEAADGEPPLAIEPLAGRDLKELIQTEARQSFGLTQDWLVRARLIEVSPSEHVFALTLHHLIADNHSLGVLLRELSTAYASPAANGNPAFATAPSQFLDFLAREAGRPGNAKSEDAAFWRDRAQGPHESSANRRDPAGDWSLVAIPCDVTNALKDLARREQSTLYMTLLAAFGALFHRQTGRESFSIGAPVSQRDFLRAEEMVGLLVHTVPVRMTFENDPTFRELLRRVKAEAIACFRHARSLAAFPPFETVFQLIDDTASALQLPGVSVTEIPTRTGTSKFDLTVSLAEKAGVLRGNAEFSHAAYDAATVARWMERYVALLRGVVEAPDRPISEISILNQDERRLVVTEWNRTETIYPRQAAIHELFEEQARLRPDATALVFGDQKMTYGELDRRANGVAEGLRRQGVKRGDFVAISMERSPKLIAGLIGILKAGAAYVPLDADYPQDRLDYMRRDSGAKVTLNNEDESWNAVVQSADAGRVASAATDNAYVIYTSGSTGQPKGVVVPHRAVVRLVKETNYAAFGHNEVFLQFAPVSFDASTFEIWGALLNGATLAIYPARFESLSQFGSVLQQHGVTTLWLTSGLFHQMVENNLDALRAVRQLLAGGDVLSPTCVKTVLRALPNCRLINGYGPTENTTFSCCHTIPRDWDGGSVPIGRSISNTRAYIVDKNFQPTGVGAPGELCVTGDGLAVGYLNHPELTAEKFVPDPFSNEPGARLYRTGDLARFLADGSIEFLGRIDQQVKIRGFRVELGEVEEALRAHPSIAQAAVVARADSTQTKHLAAYVVARPGHTLDIGEMRRFLRERLPAHLTPSRFLALASLPLTANGKVDRKRLPADGEVASVAETLTPPRTETERQLAAIWQELLGVKELGVEQNFFELGGHSLLAMRLQSRVFQTSGVALSLRDIFENPTIAALAARAAASASTSPAKPALIPRRARREAVPA